MRRSLFIAVVLAILAWAAPAHAITYGVPDGTGHPNVGHLGLNEVVQGHEIVLEGVESGEAERLAEAVERAVEATNRACADAPDDSIPLKPREEADSIARTVAEHQQLGDTGIRDSK